MQGPTSHNHLFRRRTSGAGFDPASLGIDWIFDAYDTDSISIATSPKINGWTSTGTYTDQFVQSSSADQPELVTDNGAPAVEFYGSQSVLLNPVSNPFSSDGSGADYSGTVTNVTSGDAEADGDYEQQGTHNSKPWFDKAYGQDSIILHYNNSTSKWEISRFDAADLDYSASTIEVSNYSCGGTSLDGTYGHQGVHNSKPYWRKFLGGSTYAYIYWTGSKWSIGSTDGWPTIGVEFFYKNDGDTYPEAGAWLEGADGCSPVISTSNSMPSWSAPNDTDGTVLYENASALAYPPTTTWTTVGGSDSVSVGHTDLPEAASNAGITVFAIVRDNKAGGSANVIVGEAKGYANLGRWNLTHKNAAIYDAPNVPAASHIAVHLQSEDERLLIMRWAPGEAVKAYINGGSAYASSATPEQLMAGGFAAIGGIDEFGSNGPEGIVRYIGIKASSMSVADINAFARYLIANKTPATISYTDIT